MLEISHFLVTSKTWKNACHYAVQANDASWHTWIMQNAMASNATVKNYAR